MATVKELGQHIGQYGYLLVRGMEVEVRVTDARVSFGAVQLEIEPVSGMGSQWVDQDSVRGLIREEAK